MFLHLDKRVPLVYPVPEETGVNTWEILTICKMKVYLDFAQSKETIDEKQEDEGDDPENAEGTTVFVKNLNFNTTEETLKEVLRSS